MDVVVDTPSGAPDSVAVAFVVPMQGATGIYGPSCLACGRLAAEELNATTGLGGRRVELVLVDAGRAPEVVAADVARLVDRGAVQAVAGWHISAVRQAITRRVGGRVVYAYAAMHEGRDDTSGLFMLGERPAKGLTAYSVSKAGLVAMAKGLALDLAPAGITVNVVAPGWFDSPLAEGWKNNPKLAAAILGHTAQQRWGDAADLAGAYQFLASDASAFVTGTALSVDGGYLLV